MKIIGGAIATPIIVVVLVLRGATRSQVPLPDDPVIIVLALAVCTVIGAGLGGLLAMKDFVEARKSAGRPVWFPLRLLFGFGIWSLLFVWFPAMLMLGLGITILTLN